ncbi:MAG TPA: NAD(P)-dependent oxidoreductase, partial [Nitrosopumilaceae archaeon]|nr:NAD(P)-dependent oxidoreductase [Nitrosopumilaceae archaeon]
MNIIVTGAAGFMGSWIAEELCKNHRVFGIDDYSGGDWHNWKRFYDNDNFEAFNVDLRNLSGVNKIVERAEPEILVHLAANAREGASQFQPVEVCSRNLGAYANILESCIKRKIKRVVLFSSMAVYGKGTPPFDETFATNPVDVYGVNKAAMEKITKILSGVHNFESVIIRPHNVFGERQSL